MDTIVTVRERRMAYKAIKPLLGAIESLRRVTEEDERSVYAERIVPTFVGQMESILSAIEELYSFK